MDSSNYISEFLKINGIAKVPEFGVFTLQNSGAQIQNNLRIILPPAKQVFFESDYLLKDDKLAHFIAKQKSISFSDANSELKSQTEFWKNKIAANEGFEIQKLGTFSISEGKILFSGIRIHKDSPDYYGLEEILIANIKNSRIISNDEKNTEELGNYKFNNSILWLFLLIIPILGLLFLGIKNQEMLFGKKSFKDVSVKTATHRIENDSLKKDTLKNSKLDSINKKDTLQSVGKTSGK